MSEEFPVPDETRPFTAAERAYLLHAAEEAKAAAEYMMVEAKRMARMDQWHMNGLVATAFIVGFGFGVMLYKAM